MVRVQVRLSEQEHEAAKREAARRGLSVAELMREGLRKMLPVDRSKPWMRYCGMIASGNRASSREIDCMVYGRRK